MPDQTPNVLLSCEGTGKPPSSYPYITHGICSVCGQLMGMSEAELILWHDAVSGCDLECLPGVCRMSFNRVWNDAWTCPHNPRGTNSLTLNNSKEDSK